METRNPTGYGPFLPILEELIESAAIALEPPRDPPWGPSSFINPTDILPRIRPPGTDTVACYTDASVIESHALRTSDGTSPATAEILAICICLGLLEERPDWLKAVVLTDSRIALEDIAGPGHSPIATRARELIGKLRDRGKKISIYRIPAHAGIQGNEEVDRLARKGTNNHLIDVPIPISYEDIRARTLRTMTEEWQKRWDQGGTGREFKQHRDRTDTQIRRSHTNRHKEIMMTRLRMGHTKLNAGLHKIQLHPNGECRGKKEDTDHIITKCPARADLHNRLGFLS